MLGSRQPLYIKFFQVCVFVFVCVFCVRVCGVCVCVLGTRCTQNNSICFATSTHTQTHAYIYTHTYIPPCTLLVHSQSPPPPHTHTQQHPQGTCVFLALILLLWVPLFMFSSGNPTYAVPTLTTVTVNTSVFVETPHQPMMVGTPHAAFPLYSGGMQWLQRPAFEGASSIPSGLRGWGLDQLQLLCVSQVGVVVVACVGVGGWGGEGENEFVRGQGSIHTHINTHTCTKQHTHINIHTQPQKYNHTHTHKNTKKNKKHSGF